MSDDATDRRGAQLPLIPSDDDGGEALRRAIEGPRGPGRPAGSPNKRTEAVVEYMLRRYRSPLEALAGIYSRPLGAVLADLADALEVMGVRAKPSWGQVLDVLRLQVAAAKELAPYLHQKQPTAVEVDAKGSIPIGIFLSPEAAEGLEHAVSQGQLTIDASVTDFEENQEVTGEAGEQLDASELDAEGKSDE